MTLYMNKYTKPKISYLDKDSYKRDKYYSVFIAVIAVLSLAFLFFIIFTKIF